MKCPACGFKKTFTPDTRNDKNGNRRRKRQCIKCGHVFRTIETLVKKKRESDNISKKLERIKKIMDEIEGLVCN